MADTFKLISIISFILAAIFFLSSIVIFIYFRINRVIGDLSGRNEKKSIKRMQNQNSNQIYASNAELIKSNNEYIDEESKKQHNNDNSEKTEQLSNSNMYCAENENTTLLNIDKSEEITALNNDYGSETTILGDVQLLQDKNPFIVKKEIIFIHTAETIRNKS
ncbi:MAG: hypothetical protein K2M73_05570 [Lachnospiraceae bacterium]|nr:hypothetical protein [Lachnospiraceae bacterium]